MKLNSTRAVANQTTATLSMGIAAHFRSAQPRTSSPLSQPH
jgi:hypothetical protein